MVTPTTTCWQVAADVPDPELPMLTLADLGILRSVREVAGTVVVVITPTYTGCPALREMQIDIRHRLGRAGFDDVDVRVALSPAWTSNWITPQGRRKLADAGIAPPAPAPRRSGPIPITLTPHPRPVHCPRCGSSDTTETARFSGTACKAGYRCLTCREPFEYVKEI